MKIQQSRTQFLLFILLFTVGPISQIHAASFKDVPETASYYSAVEYLKENKIVQGYEDQTFKPAQPVMRAEALKMVLSPVSKKPENGFYNTGFKDVAIDSWFAGYVLIGQLNGIIQGTPDGNFLPSRTVTKAEYLKMLLLAFQTDLKNQKNLTEQVSADTKLTDWYIPYINYGITLGLIYPDEKNNIAPGKALNRAECAQILYRLIVIVKGGEKQKYYSIIEAKLSNAFIQTQLENGTRSLKLSSEAVNYADALLQKYPEDAEAVNVKHLTLAVKYFYQANEFHQKKSFEQAKSALVSASQELENIKNPDPNLKTTITTIQGLIKSLQ